MDAKNKVFVSISLPMKLKKSMCGLRTRVDFQWNLFNEVANYLMENEAVLKVSVPILDAYE